MNKIRIHDNLLSLGKKLLGKAIHLFLYDLKNGESTREAAIRAMTDIANVNYHTDGGLRCIDPYEFQIESNEP